MNQDLTLPLKNPSVVDSTSDLSLNSRQLSHFKMRKLKSKLFSYACRGSAYLTIFVLLTLLVNVLWTGLSWLDFQFLSSFSSRLPSKAGIFAGIVGSTWLLVLTTLIAVPVGVGAGIYLEEIAKNTRMRRILDLSLIHI